LSFFLVATFLVGRTNCRTDRSVPFFQKTFVEFTLNLANSRKALIDEGGIKLNDTCAGFDFLVRILSTLNPAAANNWNTTVSQPRK
jgi:hypothetical protein